MEIGIVNNMLEEYENDQLYDDMVGWTEGLNKVNQEKCYVSMNSISFEKYSKKGIYNVGNMGSSLMLHYISQDDEFMSWYRYKDHIRLTGNYGDIKINKQYIKELVTEAEIFYYNSSV